MKPSTINPLSVLTILLSLSTPLSIAHPSSNEPSSSDNNYNNPDSSQQTCLNPNPASIQLLTPTSLIFACPAASWPPGPLNATGATLVPQAPDHELQSILSEISAENMKSTTESLISFGTRHTLSSQTDPKRGIGAATKWVEGEMRKYAAKSGGRMEVTVPSYMQPADGAILFPVKISDVVATMKGSGDPKRVYVISGHLDSRVTDLNNYTADAPGADDDASGVAISMELARIVATRNPAATMVFAVVAGEEQGLYGSNFLASTYRNASVDVQGMFTNDIVGASTAQDGTKDPYTIRLFAEGVPTAESPNRTKLRESIGGENDSPARELARFTAEVAENKYTGMNVPVIYRLDRFLRGGDHIPFLKHGYPACRFTEPNENFAHQHQFTRIVNGVQFGDLIDFVDFEYIQRVGKVSASAMWSLANSPGTPTGVSINATVLSNESQFSWTMSNETLLAGYEIVWRPTNAPFWTHSIPVGMVNTAEVYLSKDNVIFGIRAVGKNGYKSPAAFPFPLSSA